MLYFLICAIIAFWGHKRSLNFLKVFTIGIFMTPIISCIYVLSSGKIRVGVLFFTIYFVIAGFYTLYQVHLKDSICNYIMRDLDYKSANGTKIVTLDIDTGKYSLEYIPTKLEAKTKRDVGYILEVSYDSNYASYTGGSVKGEVIHTKLIDCNTGKIIDQKTFEAVFPNRIEAGTQNIYVQESEVSTWLETISP